MYPPGDRIGEADGNRAPAQIAVGIYTYGGFVPAAGPFERTRKAERDRLPLA